MSNLAYDHVSEYEYVKQVFLDKGFPEEVVQYVLNRNVNYNYENLRIRMTVLEEQMVALNGKIEKLDEKIDAVRSELSNEIKEVRNELSNEIKEVRNELSNEIKEVRSELSNEIKEVRNELSNEIKEVRNELKGDIISAIRPLYWIFGFIGTLTVGTMIAIFTMLFQIWIKQ
ncbi:Bdr family repetitive protein [Candidatus Borreliella tachyglossi]|uniref:Bdr family repetitive protein n=1 Tax=Candidatus Borreliella tachyglossi TaxID=1964448 RepID=UPI004040EEA6